MASVCFYFQIHQPMRLRRYSVFDTDRHYFDDYKNAEICRKVGAQMLSAGQSDAAGDHPRSRGPVPHRLLHHRLGPGADSAIRARGDGYVPPTEPDGMRGIPQRDVLPLPGIFVLAGGIPGPGGVASAIHQEAFRPGAAGLPQHRADLQQRPGPFRQPHGLRRDPRPRGPTISWAIAARISSTARRMRRS